MKPKILETVKTVLIVLLVCSLILLSIFAIPTQSVRSLPWLSWLLQPFAPVLGLSEADLTYVEQADSVPHAAQPIAISIRNEAGRRTFLWNFAELDDAFDVFSPVLGQALDAAEQFMEVSELQIRAALSGSSVLFRYHGQLPPSLLCAWLDGRLDAAVTPIDTCILAVQNGALTLYLPGSTNYAAHTGLSAQLLLPLLEAYTPDGSALGFEQEADLDPLSLLSDPLPTVPAYQYSRPTDSRTINAIATSLGFNPYAETRYTNDQGTACFNETNSSLEITTAGRVLLRAQSDRFCATEAAPAAIVEAARQLTASVLNNISGESRLYLSSFTQAGALTVCEFQYVLQGTPVQLSEPAARVIFSGTAVTEMFVHLYSFTATGKLLHPLPVAQACAIVQNGSRLELGYYPETDGTLTAGWIQ